MPHKFAKQMLEYAQDAQETDTPWERWEFKHNNSWESLSMDPAWTAEEYRRKQIKHPVNISLIGRYVDCEFYAKGLTTPVIDFLQNVISSRGQQNDIYEAASGHRAIRCKPRTGVWMPNNTFTCPLPAGFTGIIRDPYGNTKEIKDFKDVDWSRNASFVIASFMITGLLPSYKYPWE